MFPVRAATAPSRIGSGGEVLPNNQLQSPNRAYRLLYQPDGNLVLYRGAANSVIWASNTTGRTPGRVIMQGDGNLVMYGPDGNVHWHSSTFGPGNENSVLVLQDDGKLAIVNAAGQTIWVNGVATPVSNAPVAPFKLTSGAALMAGESLLSVNGTYQLTYHTDGNLVLYRLADGVALWATGTSGRPAGRVIMQTDGNLVIYGPDGGAQWSSGTNSAANQNSELVLQTDGSLVIIAPGGREIWRAMP